jgi:hypothetical protein
MVRGLWNKHPPIEGCSRSPFPFAALRGTAPPPRAAVALSAAKGQPRPLSVALPSEDVHSPQARTDPGRDSRPAPAPRARHRAPHRRPDPPEGCCGRALRARPRHGLDAGRGLRRTGADASGGGAVVRQRRDLQPRRVLADGAGLAPQPTTASCASTSSISWISIRRTATCRPVTSRARRSRPRARSTKRASWRRAALTCSCWGSGRRATSASTSPVQARIRARA